MPEYCTSELGLAIKVLCHITSAITCEGNGSTYEYVFSKSKNFLSNERVEKLVNNHGNLHKIISRKRLAGAAAKPSSSLLNYLRNKIQHELMSVSV